MWYSLQAPRRARGGSNQRADRLHRDIDGKPMLAASEDDAAQWRDVPEIAPPCDGHVLNAHPGIVRGVELNPAERWTIHRDPGVRRTPADQPRILVPRAGLLRVLRRSRPRTDIAADVARRKSARAQTGDHQMREVLADTVALFQHLHQRRRHGGLSRCVAQLPVQRSHQVTGAAEDWFARRKALGAKFGEGA